MANLFTIVSPSPRVNLSAYSDKQIAIVSPSPRVAIFGAGAISVVVPSPLVALSGESRSFNIAIVSPSPVFVVHGLVGDIPGIRLVSPSPRVTFSGSTSVIGTFHLVSPSPQVLVNGLIGNIGHIAIVSPSPVVYWNELPLVHAQISILSPSPNVNLHGDVIPLTFNRKAIVMHLFNYAVSHYINYNFNSLFHFNGFFFGTNENGVYFLDGGNDLGELIQAEIGSGLNDLGVRGAITIPREAWLAYRSDDGMELDTKIDEVTDLPPIIFDKTALMIREARGKLGRGIKARFFTWKLKNVSGSDFSLESLRILGDMIKRKTR